MPFTRVAARAALLLPLLLAAPRGPIAGEAVEPVDFERQILPLFEHKCFSCHSAELRKPKGDLRLDDAAALRAATGAGKAIVPGKPDESPLARVVALPAGDDDVMPPAKESSPLTKAQIGLIREWIAQGAKTGTWTASRKQAAEPRPAMTAEEARDTRQAAERVDQLILAGLARSGVRPNPRAPDPVFLRRVYLDLAGRHPTVDEAERFLRDGDAAKRAKLIDSLLASEAFVSRAFNYWADALRAKNDFTRSHADSYLAWLKQAIRENRPYDRLVREMLTAEGRYWKTPATGYHLRDSGNRFAGVEATSALFLGTQIGCAQCHDHPYDKWTRRDYHAFAGYIVGMSPFLPNDRLLPNLDGELVARQQRDLNEFGRLRNVARKREKDGETGVVAKVAVPKLAGLSPEMERKLLELAGDFDFDNITYGLRSKLGTQISAPGKPWSKYYWASLPNDYQYKDGKPKERIQPAVLFGESPKVAKPEELPAALAAWMTAQDNPRFATVIANRMWTWMMAAPICGPVTEVLEIERSADPRLMRHLEALMIASGYDLRQVLRVLANTEAYQREAVVVPVDERHPRLLAGPRMRRLTAEEIWDSLLVLIDADIDATVAKEFPDEALQERLYQAKTLDEYYQAIIDERARQKSQGDTYFDRLRKLGEMKKVGFDAKRLTRASEIQSPAPAGHFLRIFGQSDRELIDHAWSNPTVPQTLTLMNGPLIAEISRGDSALQRALASRRTPQQKVAAVFLAVLARTPTTVETAIALDAIRDGQEHRYEDLAWALINSRQFLFKH